MRNILIVATVLLTASAHGQSNAVFTVKANEIKATVQPHYVGNFFRNAVVTMLKGDQLDEMNSLTDPFKIKPINQQVELKGKTLSLSMAPYSVNVVRIKMR